MTKSPEPKTDQKRHQTVLRLPPELADEIRVAAEQNGRSMNAEIIARLQAGPLEAVMSRLDRMEGMLRVALDQI